LKPNSTHTNDVNGNPAFVHYAPNDETNSDFHLGVGSPDIASGTTTNAPAFDSDGNPIPLGASPDVGAYAYNPSRTR
jgi:hypothetical protein